MGDRDTRAGQLSEAVGIVFGARDEGGLAGFQGRADAVGAGELFRVAVSGYQLDVVEGAIELPAGGDPGQDHSVSRRQDHADRFVDQAVR